MMRIVANNKYNIIRKKEVKFMITQHKQGEYVHHDDFDFAFVLPCILTAKAHVVPLGHINTAHLYLNCEL